MNSLLSMIGGGEDEEQQAETLHKDAHKHDLSEGDEFLDEDVRMTEQPFEGE